MNDPGLDGPLEDIEKSRREHDDEIEAEKEEENMLLDPRYDHLVCICQHYRLLPS